jgi:segregation and condensation protein A
MQEEKLYSLMTSKDAWEGTIRDIVTSEGLDPWDIDVSLLADMFIKAVRAVKQKDLIISGKFILAAAILLKMKADYLLEKEEAEAAAEQKTIAELLPPGFSYELEPHVPVPKQRKVTLDELLSSLRKALVVKERREIRYSEKKIEAVHHIRRVDVAEKIKGVYSKVVDFFKKFKIEEITFSQLTPSKHRWDILWTFLPLIHLANKDKVRLRQDEAFGEIYVRRGEETEGRD